MFSIYSICLARGAIANSDCRAGCIASSDRPFFFNTPPLPAMRSKGVGQAILRAGVNSRSATVILRSTPRT